MMNGRYTAIQLTTLVILTLTGFGGPLEDAQRLMGEKKFAEAEALLAPLADSGKPLADVLLAATQSSMALGHFLSAEQRAGKLLALDPRRPEALLLGAEASWYGGNTDSACARYRLFIRSQSGRSPELERAFARLLTTLPSPDEFEAYLKLYGNGAPAWYFAVRQMDMALDALDGNQLLRLAAAALPAFGSPGQLRAVQWRLRRAVEAQFIDPAAALDVIFRVRNPDMAHAHQIRRRISDNTEKVRWLFRMQDSHGEAFGNWDMFRDFYDMHGIADQTVRTEFGRQYLGLEKIYSADPEMYRWFIHLIADRPRVFKEGNLVDSRQMAQRLTKLAAAFKDNPGRLRDTTQLLFDQYLEDEQRIAVIRAHPKAFHARYIRWISEKTGAMQLERLIAGVSLHFGDQVDLYGELLPLYKKAEDGNGLLKAATEYVMAQPGTFDVHHLQNHFFHSNAVDMDRKYALLGQLWRGAGANPRLVSLVTELEKREEWKKYPAFPAFVEAVRKGESKGNNPLMHAHAQLHNMREIRRRPDAAIYTLAEAAVKSWKGTLDTLDDRDSVLARSLVGKHWSHVHENGDEFAKAARLWAPKLGRTEHWNQPMRRLREHRQGDALRELFSVYEALIKAGWNGTEDAWREFFSMTLPKKSEQSPLRAYYGRVDASTGWNHINLQLQDNQGLLTDQALVHETEALLKAHPPKPGDDWIVNTRDIILDRLRRNSKLTDPDAYIHAFWMAVCNESRVSRDHAWRLGELMGLSGMGGKILSSVLPHLKDLPPGEKLTLLQYALIFAPGEADNAAPAAGHKRDILFNHMQPLIKSLKPLQAMDVRLHGLVFHELERATRGPGTMKTDALALLDTLGTWVAFGMPVTGGRHDIWGGLSNTLKRALAAGNSPLAAMIARMVVTNASGSWGEWQPHAVEPMLGQLEAAKVNHVLAGSLRILLNDRETPADLRQRAAVMLARAGQDVGLYPVPPNDPTYPLYVAADAVRDNNEARAWELTEPRLQLVAREWEKLDKNYVAWTAEKLRQRMDFDLSMNMIRLLLSKEQELDQETAARAMLIKADISRDRKDYPLAQAEYQSLRDNNRYANTAAAQTARFRIVELMIMVRNYSEAETVMERMRISSDALVQAQAHYYAALIAFNQEMYDESWKELENCFKVKFDHSEGRLLEGQLKVVTRRRLDDPLVMVGREGRRARIVPGRQLALRIQDRERVAGGGGSSIPVLVRTSRGDEERVTLLQSSGAPSSFVAFLPTQLGKPVPGNLTIELYGNDEVIYEIDPEFRRARNLPDYPPQILVVADNARLSVSSGQILTEEEAEKRALQESLEGVASQSLRERSLRANTVRPGGNIYVQVRDFDRSITDGKDSVTVDLQTSSGAQVTGFELREIEPYTGIFRGRVPTALPPPRATASDSEDGRDPNVLISPQGGTWASLSDGNKGKWIEVDTHSSHVFATAMLEMPDPAAVKNLRLEGMLAGDYRPIAAYPPRKGRAEGGCVVEVLLNGQERRVDHMRMLISRTAQERKRMPGCQFDQEQTDAKGPQRSFIARVAGHFYLPEYRRLELKFLNEGQPQGRLSGHVFINGRPIFSGDISRASVEEIFEVELPKGVHSFELLLRQSNLRGVQVTLGYRAGDGEFKPIPDEWFSTEANSELASFLEPGAQITRSDKGFEAAFTTANRYRRLRWVFDDFTGNAVSATRITVTNQERKTILPIATETAATTTNQVLGVSPGDTIDVVYRDEVTLEGDSPERTAQLNASFYDGDIMVANEIVTQARDGRHITEYVPSMRCQPGDQLSILVTDFDEDMTAKADIVTVNVKTSAGEQISLKAVEIPDPHSIGREVHTGRFMAVLRTGDTTDELRGMIRVREGDQVVVSYLDRENLNPGIPYERRYSIQASGPTETRIRVHPVTVRMVDDTSEEARNRLTVMRRRGVNTEGLRVLRSQFTAWDLDQRTTDARHQESIPVVPEGTDIRTSAGAPLVFEVVAPSAALHQASTFEAVVVSGSELEAARQEGREPVLATVLLRLVGVVSEARSKGYAVQFLSGRSSDERQLLQRGVFTGLVRLQIGSPGDPINDLITTSSILDDQNLENRVPTIVVSGSDVVYIRAKDLKTGEMIESRVSLASEGQISLLDPTGTAELSMVHLGERLMVRLIDYDQDTTPERDTVTLTARSAKTGAGINLRLDETLARSGIFTALFNPVFVREAGEVDRAGRLPVDYGDEITFTYKDAFTLQPDTTREVTAVARIHHGADGELAVFSKRYVDPEMAVKVRFLWAEALFEMAKGLRTQNAREGAMERTAEGERILTEALRDYPNTSLKTQGEYLLANLAEELAEDETDQGRKTALYERAIVRYSNIAATWPDSDYAPRAQFKKALCLERIGKMDIASEEYVKLTYTWPDHELVADATTRLGQHYYRTGNYGVAARIFQSFARNRPTHPLTSRTLFLAAQCRIKQATEYAEGGTPAIRARAREEYEEAIQILSNVTDTYKDDSALRAEAMYWVGDCSFKIKKFRESYIAFKTLTFEYPETEWAKRARGYLTDAAFAGIEE